jgi:hypothetical protein
MSAVSTTAAPTAAETITLPRALARRLALPLLFVAATAYHFLQSRGHATPSIFDDELLYAKLSQAIAAGDGLSIRGEHFFFPAPLAPLVQAPAWLLGSMPDAFAAAKLLNAAVMSTAAFPAYWLARRIVRPSFALLTAAGAVATPAMLYHAYLMSEALAYPIFLFAIAILARAVAEPSRRMAFAVPAVCALAVATRVQFLVVPLAYLAAVALCAHGSYRRHALPVALTATLVAVLIGVPGALGQYGGATHLGKAPGAVAHWALMTGYLLPFSLGLAIVPAALFGLGLMLTRPRLPSERAVAVLTVVCTMLFLGQAALIAAGEANRPLERYLFYVTPLAFLAFFVYAERGAPGRLRYVLTACAAGLALSLVSLAGLTGTTAFFFDSVTLSGFARAGYLIGLPDASLLYSLAPVALALLACAVPLRRRGAPELFALIAIAISLATGAAVYTTDRLATGWVARTYGSQPLDWLDRSKLGTARYLALSGGDPFLGKNLESWNRALRGVVVLGTPARDPFPTSVARVARDGTLEIDGSPATAQTLVANVSGSAIDLEGRVVARPRDGLVAYRIRAGAHVHSLAWGLPPDGWIGTHLGYQAWPTRPGRYVLNVYLPDEAPVRTIHIGKRTLTVRPGSPRRIVVPTTGAALELNVEASGSPLSRIFGLQVRSIRFVPA